MSYESSNGLGVKTKFGPSQAGDHLVAGGYHSEGALQTIAIKFDETMLGTNFIDVHLPSGAQVVSATLKVTTGFVGATAVLEIGTKGSEATNGISWAVANIGTANRTVDGIAPTGTWANPLTTSTKIGIAESTAAFTAGAGSINLVYRMG
tara:strand:- start:178 stop:627 length:450 start_codon:yes stop_codon:yes gene_type:complete